MNMEIRDLLNAINDNEVQKVQSILQTNPGFLNQEGSEGINDAHTPLTFALSGKKTEIVRFLLGFPDLEPNKPSGRVRHNKAHPLEIATRSASIDALQLLIDDPRTNFRHC